MGTQDDEMNTGDRDLDKYIEKTANEFNQDPFGKREKKFHIILSGRPERTTPISESDVADLVIALETSHNFTELFAHV